MSMNLKLTHDYIERLSNLLRNEFRREGGAFGLQPIQLEALHYLSMCNRYSDTPMAVTEYLGQTKGTISQSLKILENKGFITKHADANDRRMTHLQVTPSGENLVSMAIPVPLFTNAEQYLDEKSQDRIVVALKQLLHAVQRSNGMKSFGVCSSCRYNQKNSEEEYFCGLTKETLTTQDIQLICREHEAAA